ncbi:MAG: hypothetical protein AAGA75_14200 [Cyanobacteria bacterium P01_E01_bin.6]
MDRLSVGDRPPRSRSVMRHICVATRHTAIAMPHINSGDRKQRDRVTIVREIYTGNSEK